MVGIVHKGALSAIWCQHKTVGLFCSHPRPFFNHHQSHYDHIRLPCRKSTISIPSCQYAFHAIARVDWI